MGTVEKSPDDYVTRVAGSPGEISRAAWNELLALQQAPSPFMRHEYLQALHDSGSAVAERGWTPAYLTLWRDGVVHAACPLYLKEHSYGEYVFDWAWANAYEQHGLAYYPKGLVAVPFTPVAGSRLLARDAASRAALVRALLALCRAQELSSLHLLFLSDEDAAACQAAGLLGRETVQFHWLNQHPVRGDRFAHWDDFLASLSQDKRKKIRQERRKVSDAGVRFRIAQGNEISPDDWEFFYRCYARTYREHGNPPYLTRDFFDRMASQMPQHWVMFIAEQGSQPIACSLVGTGDGVAYGRYWGALARVDCLHFEACYYQPLAWCVANGIERFEGGAQGEHKMARALMPVATRSAHWLAHPAFSDAVERFLEREGQGVAQYLEHLERRSPFREPGETQGG